MPSAHLVKAVEKMAKKIEAGEIVVEEKKKKTAKHKKGDPVYDMWGMDEKKNKKNTNDNDDEDDAKPKKVRISRIVYI